MTAISQRMGELSVRALPVGGKVAKARFDADHLVREGKGGILLIHGFAVVQPSARQRYQEFRRNLRSPLADQTVDVCWPGDAGTPAALAKGTHDLPSTLFSVATYPLQLKRAEASAVELMLYVEEQLVLRANLAAAATQAATKFQLWIVAHSLGCLVALELLKGLRGLLGRDLEVPLVVLMAAAVPQYRMRDHDFGYVIDKIGRMLVFYSFRDRALDVAFSTGQLLQWHFPAGLLSRGAVGRYGLGRTFAHAVQEEGRRDHGDYWADSDIAAALRGEMEGRPYTPPHGPKPGRSFIPRPFAGRLFGGRRMDA